MQPLKQKLAELPLTPEVTATLVADRCRHEPELAERLHKDARNCLKELTDKELPEDLKIVTHDNTDDTWHLPLPNYSMDEITDRQQMELDEEQLQQIAAGELLATIIPFAIAVTVSVAVIVGIIAGKTEGFQTG